MQPLLNPGDYVLVLKTRKIKKGDVVLCYHPLDRKKLVKRVKDILPGGLFVIRGDNLLQSTDSRHFGPITEKKIIGKVVWVIHR